MIVKVGETTIASSSKSLVYLFHKLNANKLVLASRIHGGSEHQDYVNGPPSEWHNVSLSLKFNFGLFEIIFTYNFHDEYLSIDLFNQLLTESLVYNKFF